MTNGLANGMSTDERKNQAAQRRTVGNSEIVATRRRMTEMRVGSTRVPGHSSDQADASRRGLMQEQAHLRRRSSLPPTLVVDTSGPEW